MSLLLLRRFHDDLTAPEMDRGALTVSGQRQLGAIVDFNYRAVSQTDKGVRIARRPDQFTAFDLLTGAKGRALRVVDPVHPAFSRLHGGFQWSKRQISLH